MRDVPIPTRCPARGLPRQGPARIQEQYAARVRRLNGRGDAADLGCRDSRSRVFYGAGAMKKQGGLIRCPSRETNISGCGTFETCRQTPRMCADGGRPEMTGRRSKRRYWTRLGHGLVVPLVPSQLFRPGFTDKMRGSLDCPGGSLAVQGWTGVRHGHRCRLATTRRLHIPFGFH